MITKLIVLVEKSTIQIVLCALFISLFFNSSVLSQYTLTVESSIPAAIPGTTYRFYVNMLDPSDRMSAVFGLDTAPLEINAPSGVFNSAFAGGWSAAGINPSFLSFFPELADDTYATIGLDVLAGYSGIANEADPMIVEDSLQPITPFFTTNGATSLLSNTFTGATYFVMSDAANGLPDANMRVLIMQVTTDGPISGIINFQVFPLGLGSNASLNTIPFDGVGTFDAAGLIIPGCTDTTACNFDPTATTDDGSCIIPTGCDFCSNGAIVNGDINANGVCDTIENTGCMDILACNYDPSFIISGPCDYFSCSTIGCTNTVACNYNPQAEFEDGSCIFPLTAYKCDGSCVNDSDGDGICDEFEILGCTDNLACNFDTLATENDSSCTYPEPNFDCNGVCILDINFNGVCDLFEVYGCGNPSACNYDPTTTVDDGTCEFISCLVSGCTDVSACNFDLNAELDDFSCVYPLTGYSCLGVCLVDTDGDGICDPFEIFGCTDTLALNLDALATEDDGSCLYPIPAPTEFNFTPTPFSGTLIGSVTVEDIPGDLGDWVAAFDPQGVCAGAAEVQIISGVAYITLVIYGDDLLSSSIDEGLVDGDYFSLKLYDHSSLLFYDWTSITGSTQLTGWANTNGAPMPGYNDPTIIYNFSGNPYIQSCIDPNACNFNPQGSNSDNCIYPDTYYDCNGNCWFDTDGDGVCDQLEIPGCTDVTACNYNASATDADGSCTIIDECGICGGQGIPIGNCDCNGNQLDALGICGGLCASDVDGNGVCDNAEMLGCMDSAACNYDGLATQDDGLCATLDVCGICGGYGIPAGYCDCNGNQLDALGICGGLCVADADADGVCDDIDPCIGTLDACGICNGPGAIFECGCSGIPVGYCDCNGNQTDAIGDCGGSCTLDLDSDGICDDVDPCVGTLDTCGICNGPGAVYECGCTDIPLGDCDCNGNQLDVLGICGGTCLADSDADGICDDVDPCIGALDACGICNGPGAIYECGCSNIPSGDCDCNGNILDALGVCGGTCLADIDSDGVCDANEIFGCDDPLADNFNPSVTEFDNSCIYTSLAPDTMAFIPTPFSGTVYGNVEIDGITASGLDWIAAFDENGNCAGASTLVYYQGQAYINLTIYGDDPSSINVDEGMNTGESFSLVLFDFSTGGFLQYVDPNGLQLMSGWLNTYGAPIPSWNDPNYIFAFTTVVLCSGDFNGDGEIQLTDLLDFLTAYGSLCLDCPEDLNGDGEVQLTDLLDFLTLYGSSCL